MLRDLPPGDRTGRLRRQGSVVIASLEALTHVKETTSADTTEAEMSMHPPSGRAKAPRVYLRNRLLRRDRERRTRERVRERQYAVQLLETLVSPTRGGTESCEGAAARELQDWQSYGLKRAIPGNESGEGSPQEPRTQLSAVVARYQSPVPRSEEDRILFIVPARIFGQELRALIDSGASRSFISPAGVTRLWRRGPKASHASAPPTVAGSHSPLATVRLLQRILLHLWASLQRYIQQTRQGRSMQTGNTIADTNKQNTLQSSRLPSNEFTTERARWYNVSSQCSDKSNYITGWHLN